MKAVLIRSGSVPAHLSMVPGSPRISLSVHDSVSGVFSGEKSSCSSPRISLHLDVNNNRRGIRRAMSESDVIRSSSEVSGGFPRQLTGAGSQSFPARIPEEENDDVVVGGIGSLMLRERCSEEKSYDWPGSGVQEEELVFSGGGIGKGRVSGGGGSGGDYSGTDGGADRSKIGAYYQEMLKSNPSNPLLLRNYGKFLHEVEKDMVKAEEYYGRAILVSPGDGEVLSLYGKLIWETHRDQDRAKSYFEQAVQASPDDCAVLGSYAHFMWEAEEEEEDEEMGREVGVSSAAPMVAAF